MPKGIFTQCLTVLLDRTISLDRLAQALHRFGVVQKVDKPVWEFGGWEFAGPGLLLPLSVETNAVVMVDMVDKPWPDNGGATDEDKLAWANAWGLGCFGPQAEPGALKRSVQRSKVTKECFSRVSAHSAFLRIRPSYVLIASDDAPALPADCEPRAELAYCLDVLLAALELDESICYFNPSSQLLVERKLCQAVWSESANVGMLPLGLLMGERLNAIEGEWILIDTIGNAQYDLPDFEACFDKSKTKANEVAISLIDLTSYCLKHGNVPIEAEHTFDGAGGLWRSLGERSSLGQPERTVVRVVPDGADLPAVVLGTK